MVRSITEDGIQSLLGVVERAGLLATPPDYSGGDNVADASNTVVTINASGGNFVHSAYALLIANPESPARHTLFAAVTALSDLPEAAGAANLGVDQPFVPATYRLQARVRRPIGAHRPGSGAVRRRLAGRCRRRARRCDDSAPASTQLRSDRCSSTPSRTPTSKRATSCTSCRWRACCPATPPAEWSVLTSRAGRSLKGLDMRKCAAVALMITSVVVPVVNVAAPRVDAATVPAGFTDVQVAPPAHRPASSGCPMARCWCWCSPARCD